jgi:hypothetical protein
VFALVDFFEYNVECHYAQCRLCLISFRPSVMFLLFILSVDCVKCRVCFIMPSVVGMLSVAVPAPGFQE